MRLALVAVALLSLAGCATARRECPTAEQALREQHSQFVLWCAK